MSANCRRPVCRFRCIHFVSLPLGAFALNSHCRVTAKSTPLPAGATSPDFTLKSAPDQSVNLSDFRGRPVVLAFYPADWSPVCGDQMGLYNEILPEFQKLGAERKRPVDLSTGLRLSHPRTTARCYDLCCRRYCARGRWACRGRACRGLPSPRRRRTCCWACRRCWHNRFPNTPSHPRWPRRN